MSLVDFWLYQCQSRQAYELLERYQYHHDWIRFGDIGGLPVRISGNRFEPDENGQFMIAQGVWRDQPSLSNPVEEPMLYDVIAWHPESPHNWHFYRGEPGLVLGEKTLFSADINHDQLILHSNPFAWLKTGCTGSVLLDQHGLTRLYGLSEVVCENINHGTQVKTALSDQLAKRMPSITVPRHQGLQQWKQ